MQIELDECLRIFLRTDIYSLFDWQEEENVDVVFVCKTLNLTIVWKIKLKKIAGKGENSFLVVQKLSIFSKIFLCFSMSFQKNYQIFDGFIASFFYSFFNFQFWLIFITFHRHFFFLFIFILLSIYYVTLSFLCTCLLIFFSFFSFPSRHWHWPLSFGLLVG